MCCENFVNVKLNPFIKESSQVAKDDMHWQKLAVAVHLFVLCVLGNVFHKHFPHNFLEV